MTLIAGILGLIGGWISAALILRREERAIHIKQITEERTKWRNEMRILTQEIAELFGGENNLDNARLQKLRAKLVTLINPKDIDDIRLLAMFDTLVDRREKPENFTSEMSLLLKHDWERTKWECMPIYKKGWYLILQKYGKETPKQLGWKNENYRSVEESPKNKGFENIQVTSDPIDVS